MTHTGYELRFPFRPTHPFSDVTNEVAFNCGELTVSINWNSPEAVLRIGEFATFEAAEAFLPRVWGSLAWVALTQGIGFTAEMTWSRLFFTEDPFQAAENVAKSFGFPVSTKPLHATGDGGYPCVIPIAHNYLLSSGADATASVSIPSANFRVPFVQALSSPSADNLYHNERVRTAIQLFSDSHLEKSGRSRFLTYIIPLEVLKQPLEKHPVVLSLIEAFKETLDSKERHAIESLKKELVFRREDSLRQRIRSLVLNTLSDLCTEERESQAKDAVWAYDKRSALVHKGTLPKADLHKATEIARRTLIDVLQRKVGLPVLLPNT